MLKKIKILIIVAVISCSSGLLFAQNSTSSPYSMFGVGDISNDGFGRNMGMGGVSSSLISNTNLNPSNPASYALLQPYSFIFEVGLSGTYYKLKTNQGEHVRNDANIKYIAAGFPITKWWKAGFGLRPVTDIGYNIEQYYQLPLDSNQLSNWYKGEGGVNSFYFDNSINIFKQFSVGIKAAYMFGTINRSSSITSENDNSTNILSVENKRIFDAFSFQFGLHLHQKLSEKLHLNIGATYGLNTKLSADYEKLVTSETTKYYPNTRTESGIFVDTIFSGLVNQGSLNIPASYGLGTSLIINQKLEIAADYQVEKWSNTEFFGEIQNFKDNERLSIGVEYTPEYNGIKYSQVIRYRAGFNKTNSYLLVDDKQLKQIGGSIGFGFPLRGGSLVNIAFMYNKRTIDGNNSLSENFFQLHLNFSLQSSMFYRYKFE